MRVLFDLSSLIRWRGPKVGMIRAQQELARYLRGSGSEIVFTVFDPYLNRPRAIRPEWVDRVIENEASVEPALLWNAAGRDRPLLRRLPRPIGNSLFWLTRFRRKLISELERGLFVNGKQGGWRERLVRRLIKDRERSLYLNDDGSLRPCPPLDMILDDTLQIVSGDVFISAQADWYHINLEAIIAEQRRGLRRVVLCYDIIPILFPEWYGEKDAVAFGGYYARSFATADRVIFNASINERDARSFCRSLGFDLTDSRIVPLGSDFSAPSGKRSLPAGLQPGRYAVFVSTIEPRKNHNMLVDVWSRLSADGVIHKADFKLVLAGRSGWKMEKFFADLTANPEFGRSIFHLESLGDDLIKTLYAEAAFSLYPSIYEGFGLPPIESMLAGAPVIASTGGAIPEVVGDAGICLDPHDPDAWYREIKRMIDDESHRQSWADRARSYRQVTWRESAERFVAAVEEPFGTRSAFF